MSINQNQLIRMNLARRPRMRNYPEGNPIYWGIIEAIGATLAVAVCGFCIYQLVCLTAALILKIGGVL